jgi:hypothetical protein
MAAGAPPPSPMRVPRPTILEMCADNAELGVAWCGETAPGASDECVASCVAEYHAHHRPPQAAPGAASIAPPPPDPYFFALADCIHRVRSGDASSGCRFTRPLDQMDFGQKHCDARCAELAGPTGGQETKEP